ncbi:hypothetical protein D0469_15875 [Peribacillus saganii]|uniref:Uncharacterized protein n=1 Tax=Peribacillus saganii TaxID=2303992 RepID=A0A372LKC4_9BACI|nr:hypothetical protein [Peribacillus saganii]RFU67099.1 hypothetical protein D0469_15875 [Peribacillus saganii]
MSETIEKHCCKCSCSCNRQFQEEQVDFSRIELIVSDIIRLLAKAIIKSENSENCLSEFAASLSSLEVQLHTLYMKHLNLERYIQSLSIQPKTEISRKQFIVHKKALSN